MLQNAVLPEPLPVPPPAPIPMPEGGGERNSNPIYAFPNAKVVSHFVPEMPVRISAMRALGAYLNIFAIESFMDELAEAAGTDPVAFRLAHLTDERASAVVKLAADRFGWLAKAPKQAGEGRGFAFARYKNLGAYCAVALNVSVEHETGRIRIGRVVAAVDSGQPINPDGIRNQIEGAMVQAASWTLYEEVRFDRMHITSVDWSGYPVLRFPAAPESVAVHIIPRPGQPFLGTGEAGQGPMAAAIANALRDAAGVAAGFAAVGGAGEGGDRGLRGFGEAIGLNCQIRRFSPRTASLTAAAELSAGDSERLCRAIRGGECSPSRKRRRRWRLWVGFGRQSNSART
jgi:xanthine dehydrogenase molybdopterin-binding subunit B